MVWECMPTRLTRPTRDHANAHVEKLGAGWPSTMPEGEYAIGSGRVTN